MPTHQPIPQEQLQRLSQGSAPWLSPNWALGGLPENHVDIPVTSVFLVLFAVGAAVHMTILQVNLKRGHKFIFSGVIFGFCMARLTTTVLRLASITHPTNTRLAIAAQIFVSAGVLLLFVVNILFAQRILRAQRPRLGWHPALTVVLMGVYVLLVLTLVVLITATVQSFYTLSHNTRRIDRDLQLYGSTLFLAVALLPLLMLAAGLLLLPRPTSPSPSSSFDKFGAGRFRTKLAILATSSLLLAFGAAYRTATSFYAPVPKSSPLPAHLHKAAFYMVNFGVEVLVVALYAAARVDLRFHTPNGARGPGSYQAGLRAAAAAAEKEGGGVAGSPTVLTEEEAFGPDEEEGKGEESRRDGAERV